MVGPQLPPHSRAPRPWVQASTGQSPPHGTMIGRMVWTFCGPSHVVMEMKMALVSRHNVPTWVWDDKPRSASMWSRGARSNHEGGGRVRRERGQPLQAFADARRHPADRMGGRAAGVWCGTAGRVAWPLHGIPQRGRVGRGRIWTPQLVRANRDARAMACREYFWVRDWLARAAVETTTGVRPAACCDERPTSEIVRLSAVFGGRIS